MELTVKSEKDNPLFDRKEVTVQIGHISVTPSRKDVLEALASKFGHKESIVIDQITHAFGRKSVQVSAKIYSKAETMKQTEPAYKQARTEGTKNGGKGKEQKTK